MAQKQNIGRLDIQRLRNMNKSIDINYNTLVENITFSLSPEENADIIKYLHEKKAFSLGDVAMYCQSWIKISPSSPISLILRLAGLKQGMSPTQIASEDRCYRFVAKNCESTECFDKIPVNSSAWLGILYHHGIKVNEYANTLEIKGFLPYYHSDSPSEITEWVVYPLTAHQIRLLVNFHEDNQYTHRENLQSIEEKVKIINEVCGEDIQQPFTKEMLHSSVVKHPCFTRKFLTTQLTQRKTIVLSTIHNNKAKGFIPSDNRKEVGFMMV